MELEGRLKQILAPAQGEGKNGPWKRQEFIVETPGDFPKEVCFTIWNDKVPFDGFAEGQQVKVFFDLSSREYNGRWYTTAMVWKMNAADGSSGPGDDVRDTEPPDVGSQDVNDDLPF